jgi:hypothetical protein
VLVPAVEAAAVRPHLLDDGADPAVAPGEQPLDQRRLTVVVPEADRPAERTIRVDSLLEQL